MKPETRGDGAELAQREVVFVLNGFLSHLQFPLLPFAARVMVFKRSLKASGIHFRFLVNCFSYQYERNKSCKAQGWWGVGHPPEYLSELSHPGEWAIFLRAPVFSAVSLGSGCTFPPAQKCPAFSLVPGTPAEGDLPCQDHGPDPAVLRTCPFLAAGPVSWTRRQGMVCMPLLESEEEASLPSMSRASGKLTIGT